MVDILQAANKKSPGPGPGPWARARAREGVTPHPSSKMINGGARHIVRCVAEEPTIFRISPPGHIGGSGEGWGGVCEGGEGWARDGDGGMGRGMAEKE